MKIKLQKNNFKKKQERNKERLINLTKKNLKICYQISRVPILIRQIKILQRTIKIKGIRNRKEEQRNLIHREFSRKRKISILLTKYIEQKKYYEQQILVKKQQHDIDFEKQQNQQVKRIQQLNEDHKHNIKDLQEKSYKIAEESIGVKQHEFKLKFHNQRLNDSIQQNMDEINKLSLESNRYQQQKKVFIFIKALMNTHEIDEGLNMHQQLHHQLTVSIAQGKNQIDYLKAFNLNEINSYEKQLQDLKNKGRERVEQYQDQIKKLLINISQKETQIAQMQKVMQMILDSRTDIENWFLEAFYEMKQVMKTNRSEVTKEKSKSFKQNDKLVRLIPVENLQKSFNLTNNRRMSCLNQFFKRQIIPKNQLAGGTQYNYNNYVKKQLDTKRNNEQLSSLQISIDN